MTKVWDINSKEYKDEIKRIEDLAINDKIKESLDINKQAIIVNETVYKDSDSYQDYKDRLMKERQELISKLK